MDPLIVYPLAGGGCVFSFAWLLLLTLAKARQQAAGVKFHAVRTSSPLLRLLRPAARWAGYFFTQMTARAERRMGRNSDRSLLRKANQRAEKLLRAAGRPEDLNGDEVLGLMVVGGVLGLLLGLALLRAMPSPAVPFFTTLIGLFFPVLQLRGIVKRRHTEIRHVLPYALDLLTLSVEAGLDFTEAIARICKRLGDSPLAEELGETLRQIQLGKTRSLALRDLSQRVNLQELRSVCSALIQTDELGGNLGPVLRAQAVQLRNLRSQQAEKAATEAPVKILFPLILFIFPTIFLIIFGPMALQIMSKSP